MSDDVTAIRTLVTTWMTASQQGDLDTVLGLMTDDVVFMTPGREPFGKEEFRQQSDAMKDMKIAGKSDIRELNILGDWAYARNYLEVTMTPPAGERVRRTGYTLTLFRKDADGRWRLARDANLLAPA
jgi:uncharacterized protein (TIGR02246 family)